MTDDIVVIQDEATRKALQGTAEGIANAIVGNQPTTSAIADTDEERDNVSDNETTETTVEKVEAFNPYGTRGDEYYVSRAWTQGKASLLKVRTGEHESLPNPFDDSQPKNKQAWQEGYEGTGVSAHAFTHPVPVEGDGVFVMPDIATLDFDGSRRSHPVMVWAYDEWSDKQDPKVKPKWADFPVYARSIKLADGHAWSAGVRWLSNQEIRGTKTYELPCPPYNFEVDGATLTISAGFFSKGGNKKDWTQVLEQMQEEVDNMPDGFYMGDDYLSVTVAARVTGVISISASSLLSGHENLDDDELWIGDADEYEAAVTDALDDYDWSYEISDMEIDMDYADWETEDVDTSDLSSG